jgi:hypothetical protein
MSREKAIGAPFPNAMLRRHPVPPLLSALLLLLSLAGGRAAARLRTVTTATAATATTAATAQAAQAARQRRVRAGLSGAPTAPDPALDRVRWIAQSYGIAGGMGVDGTDGMPQRPTVFGGDAFHDDVAQGAVEAPLVPWGRPMVASGRGVMHSHAHCVERCKGPEDAAGALGGGSSSSMTSGVGGAAGGAEADKEQEALERCLESCYYRYAPLLYAPRPNVL